MFRPNIIILLLFAVVALTAQPLLAQQPDLTASKSNDTGGAAVVGTPFNWSVTARNDGNSVANFGNGSNVLFDNLPNANMTYGSPSIVASSGFSTTPAGASLNCTINANPQLRCSAQSGTVVLQPGGFVTVQFSATPTSAGVFSNPRPGALCRVDIDDSISESNEGNNDCGTNSVTATTGATGPDLTIAKSNNVGGATSLAAGAFSWSVAVANGGSADATFSSGQTILTDNLPNTNMNYGTPSVGPQSGISGTGSISCSIVSSNLSCTASGGGVTLASGTGSFTVSFSATATAPATFNNPRSAGVCMVDPNGNISEGDESNNSCSNSVVVSGSPDMIADKANDTGDLATVGTAFNWSVTVTNNGSATANFGNGSNVLFDTLPNANMTYGSPSIAASSGFSTSPAGASLNCNINATPNLICDAQSGTVSIAAGGFVTIQFSATPTAAGVFSNPRSGGFCAADGNDSVSETNESNNSCGSNSVTASTGVTGPDLTVAKNNNVAGMTSLASGPFSWSVAVANGGNMDATFSSGQTILTDNLPNAGISYATPTVGSQSGISGAGSISCSIISFNLSCVANGGSVTLASGTGAFAIDFSAMPTAASTFNNPRPGGVCSVDPNDNIMEGDESNNSCSNSVVVNPSPDLIATKANDTGGIATLGMPFNWSVTVTNNGAATANFGNGSNVLFDSLPNADMTYGSPSIAASSGFSTSPAGASLNCSINATPNLICDAQSGTVSIAAGGFVTIQFSATPTAAGAFSNPRSGGFCAADGNDSVLETNESNNSCSDTVSVTSADISVSKDDGVSSAVPGQTTLTYSIVVSNNGPTADPVVSLNDMFPAALSCSYTSVAAGGASGNTAAGSGNLAETLNMPVSSSVSYTASCSIDAAATGTLSNTATAMGSLPDPVPGNNAATDNNTVLMPEADISVTKTDGVTTAVPGQTTLVYTIVAANNGPSDDPSVSLVDTFPAELTCTFTSAVAGGASGNTAAGAGDLAETLSMPVGSSVTYTVSCSIDSAATGPLSNTAMVSASVTDNTPGNNSATDNDTVLTPEADISVTKTDGVTSAVPGQTTLVYTIVAGNNGPSDDPSVSLSDTFPAELSCTFTSAAAGGAGGNTTAGASDLAETLSMPAGSSVTYTVSCSIDSAATGTLSNTAIVSASVTDNMPGNNSATDNDTVLTPEADISVTKDDGVTTATPGQTTLTYTIVASNNGPSDDPSVSLADTFPVELTCTFTSVAAGGATGNTAAGSGDLAETLSMPSGSSVTYTLSCDIDSAATGTLSNTVTVAASVTDNVPGNDSATDNDTVLEPEADISVTKTDGVTSATAGGSLTYTIVVTNNGPSDDPAVTLADMLPAELSCTFTSTAAGGASGNTAAGSGDLAETLDMPVGSSVSYTVSCDIDASATGTLSNTASVTASVTDPTAGNDSATDNDTVLNQEADLSISKTDSVDPVIAGTSLTYTITVDNAGPSDATNVVVTDTLPAGVTLVSSSGCSEDPAGVPTCTLGDITAGSNASYTVMVTIDSSTAGTITNTASVSSDTTDLDTGNNTATEDTQVDAEADLSISKLDDIDPIVAGNTLTYTIMVDNAGPSDATNVVVTDNLPAGVSLASSSGCAEDPAGAPTCSLGNLVSGGSAGYAIVVDIDLGFAGTLDNTAAVSAGTTDPNPANDSATQTTTVDPAVSDLVLTVSNNATPPILVGFEFDVLLELTNNGPDANADVLVTAELSNGLRFVSSGSACATAMGSTVTFDVGDLAAGASISCVFTVAARLPGIQTIVATAAGVVGDPVTANNMDIATSVVVQAIEVPTLNQWGLLLLLLVMLTLAGWRLRPVQTDRN